MPDLRQAISVHHEVDNEKEQGCAPHFWCCKTTETIEGKDPAYFRGQHVAKSLCFKLLFG